MSVLPGVASLWNVSVCWSLSLYNYYICIHAVVVGFSIPWLADWLIGWLLMFNAANRSVHNRAKRCSTYHQCSCHTTLCTGRGLGSKWSGMNEKGKQNFKILCGLSACLTIVLMPKTESLRRLRILSKEELLLFFGSKLHHVLPTMNWPTCRLPECAL